MVGRGLLPGVTRVGRRVLVRRVDLLRLAPPEACAIAKGAAMSVTVRPFRSGGWEVDIRVLDRDGRPQRERKKAPVSSKSGALRWGKARESALLASEPAKAQTPEREEVPTLAQFQDRFLNGYARANRQKPSGIAGKETILRVHLVPSWVPAPRQDHERGRPAAQARPRHKAPKTVNNVLTVLEHAA